jgi:polar amino acid transport system substrate-binding protein
MGRTVKFSRRAGIALLFPAALLAACGGSTGTNTPTASTAGSGPTKQASIAAEVPAAVAAAAPLQIATDATYAPNEFVDPSTGAIVGWDPDLAKEVCAVLGVACTINNVTFSDIIPALLESPAKYQMAFSSFTPTSAREAKGIDFITYYQAGEAWLVKTGGSTTISSAADMCGHAVAVESGTTEESDAWGYMGMQPGGAKISGDTNHCTAAGKQDITVLSFGTQTQANSALLSGRADFGWLDQPVADYQVKVLNGKVKIGGTACSVSPYGVAMVKATGLEQAVQDAIKYLIDNHFYTKLLNTWGVADGAIASSAVTVNNNSSIGASCVPSY